MADTAEIKALKESIANAAKQQAKCDDPADAEKWQGVINQNRAALADLSK